MTTTSAEYMRTYRLRPNRPQGPTVPDGYKCDCGQIATWIAPVTLRSATNHKIHTAIYLCDVCQMETQDEAYPAVVQLSIGAQEWLDLFEQAVDANVPKPLLDLLCRGRLAASPAGRRKELNGDDYESPRVKS